MGGHRVTLGVGLQVTICLTAGGGEGQRSLYETMKPRITIAARVQDAECQETTFNVGTAVSRCVERMGGVFTRHHRAHTLRSLTPAGGGRV